MCEYIEKHGIIQLIRRSVNVMFELFLMVIEKLIDEPKVLVGIVIVVMLFMLLSQKRIQYVSRKIYVDKKFCHIGGMLNRRAWMAMLWLSLLTEVVVRVSLISEKGVNLVDVPQMYIAYYVPLLLMYILSIIFVVHRKYGETYIRSVFSVIPGISLHIALLCLIMYANRSALFLGLIMLIGILFFISSDLFLLYLTARKDEKRVTVIMKGGETYDVRYDDLIENKEGLSIRIRATSNTIEKSIIVKREDVDKKIIYTKKDSVEK